MSTRTTNDPNQRYVTRSVSRATSIVREEDNGEEPTETTPKPIPKRKAAVRKPKKKKGKNTSREISNTLSQDEVIDDPTINSLDHQMTNTVSFALPQHLEGTPPRSGHQPNQKGEHLYSSTSAHPSVIAAIGMSDNKTLRQDKSPSTPANSNKSNSHDIHHSQPTPKSILRPTQQKTSDESLGISSQTPTPGRRTPRIQLPPITNETPFREPTAVPNDTDLNEEPRNMSVFQFLGDSLTSLVTAPVRVVKRVFSRWTEESDEIRLLHMERELQREAQLEEDKQRQVELENQRIDEEKLRVMEEEMLLEEMERKNREMTTARLKRGEAILQQKAEEEEKKVREEEERLEREEREEAIKRETREREIKRKMDDWSEKKALKEKKRREAEEGRKRAAEEKKRLEAEAAAQKAEAERIRKEEERERRAQLEREKQEAAAQKAEAERIRKEEERERRAQLEREKQEAAAQKAEAERIRKEEERERRAQLEREKQEAAARRKEEKAARVAAAKEKSELEAKAKQELKEKKTKKDAKEKRDGGEQKDGEEKKGVGLFGMLGGMFLWLGSVFGIGKKEEKLAPSTEGEIEKNERFSNGEGVASEMEEGIAGREESEREDHKKAGKEESIDVESKMERSRRIAEEKGKKKAEAMEKKKVAEEGRKLAAEEKKRLEAEAAAQKAEAERIRKEEERERRAQLEREKQEAAAQKAEAERIRKEEERERRAQLEREKQEAAAQKAEAERIRKEEERERRAQLEREKQEAAAQKAEAERIRKEEERERRAQLEREKQRSSRSTKRREGSLSCSSEREIRIGSESETGIEREEDKEGCERKEGWRRTERWRRKERSWIVWNVGRDVFVVGKCFGIGKKEEKLAPSTEGEIEKNERFSNGEGVASEMEEGIAGREESEREDHKKAGKEESIDVESKMERSRRIAEEKGKKKAEAMEKKKVAEEGRKLAAEEKKRLEAEAAAQKAEAERIRKEEERERRAQLEREKQEAAAQKAEAERIRKEEERERRAQLEREKQEAAAQKAEAERIRKEEERERRAQLEREKQEAAAQKAEAERIRKEEEREQEKAARVAAAKEKSELEAKAKQELKEKKTKKDAKEKRDGGEQKDGEEKKGVGLFGMLGGMFLWLGSVFGIGKKEEKLAPSTEGEIEKNERFSNGEGVASEMEEGIAGREESEREDHKKAGKEESIDVESKMERSRRIAEEKGKKKAEAMEKKKVAEEGRKLAAEEKKRLEAEAAAQKAEAERIRKEEERERRAQLEREKQEAAAQKAEAERIRKEEERERRAQLEREKQEAAAQKAEAERIRKEEERERRAQLEREKQEAAAQKAEAERIRKEEERERRAQLEREKQEAAARRKEEKAARVAAAKEKSELEAKAKQELKEKKTKKDAKEKRDGGEQKDGEEKKGVGFVFGIGKKEEKLAPSTEGEIEKNERFSNGEGVASEMEEGIAGREESEREDHKKAGKEESIDVESKMERSRRIAEEKGKKKAEAMEKKKVAEEGRKLAAEEKKRLEAEAAAQKAEAERIRKEEERERRAQLEREKQEAAAQKAEAERIRKEEERERRAQLEREKQEAAAQKAEAERIRKEEERERRAQLEREKQEAAARRKEEKAARVAAAKEKSELEAKAKQELKEKKTKKDAKEKRDGGEQKDGEEKKGVGLFGMLGGMFLWLGSVFGIGKKDKNSSNSSTNTVDTPSNSSLPHSDDESIPTSPETGAQISTSFIDLDSSSVDPTHRLASVNDSYSLECLAQSQSSRPNCPRHGLCIQVWNESRTDLIQCLPGYIVSFDKTDNSAIPASSEIRCVPHPSTASISSLIVELAEIQKERFTCRQFGARPPQDQRFTLSASLDNRVHGINVATLEEWVTDNYPHLLASAFQSYLESSTIGRADTDIDFAKRLSLDFASTSKTSTPHQSFVEVVNAQTLSAALAEAINTGKVRKELTSNLVVASDDWTSLPMSCRVIHRIQTLSQILSSASWHAQRVVIFTLIFVILVALVVRTVSFVRRWMEYEINTAHHLLQFLEEVRIPSSSPTQLALDSKSVLSALREMGGFLPRIRSLFVKHELIRQGVLQRGQKGQLIVNPDALRVNSDGNYESWRENCLRRRPPSPTNRHIIIGLMTESPPEILETPKAKREITIDVELSRYVGRRIRVRSTLSDPFTAILRGTVLDVVKPTEYPHDYVTKGKLALVKFDYCDLQYWVPHSRVCFLQGLDIYERFLDEGVEESLTEALEQDVTTICRVVGQIGLPNAFFFDAPLFGFDDGFEIPDPPYSVPLCIVCTRLFTLLSRTELNRAVDLIVSLIEPILEQMFIHNLYPEGKSIQYPPNPLTTSTPKTTHSIRNQTPVKSSKATPIKKERRDEPVETPHTSRSRIRHRDANIPIDLSSPSPKLGNSPAYSTPYSNIRSSVVTIASAALSSPMLDSRPNLVNYLALLEEENLYPDPKKLVPEGSNQKKEADAEAERKIKRMSRYLLGEVKNRTSSGLKNVSSLFEDKPSSSLLESPKQEADVFKYDFDFEEKDAAHPIEETVAPNKPGVLSRIFGSLPFVGRGNKDNAPETPKKDFLSIKEEEKLLTKSSSPFKTPPTSARIHSKTPFSARSVSQTCSVALPLNRTESLPHKDGNKIEPPKDFVPRPTNKNLFAIFRNTSLASPHPLSSIVRLAVFSTEAWNDLAYDHNEAHWDLTLMNTAIVLIDVLVLLLGLERQTNEMPDEASVSQRLHPELKDKITRVLFFCSILNRIYQSPRQGSLIYILQAVRGELPGYIHPFTPSTFDASLFGLESDYPAAKLGTKSQRKSTVD
ncbi:hypothetical protein BLNAU_2518 [Blattamonas nauphoetae]|uniref:Uncharacterized protein n=1 Tax=Blattamonas nauphoetae TaxID=2049346 RepID=A0ABQ9YG31_9EUKA|nr:hypothetical protein BLNAU_2518 [Blattamonas nauphoetae]